MFSVRASKKVTSGYCHIGSYKNVFSQKERRTALTLVSSIEGSSKSVHKK